MSRWHFLPDHVNTALAEILLKVLCDFRVFCSRWSQQRNPEIRAEYLALIDDIKACFEQGFLSWTRQLESDFELGLSQNYRTDGMLLSRTESTGFLLQRVELLTPRAVANKAGKTATDLSFLRYKVAIRIRMTQSPEARKHLWALHKLISRSTRDLINSGVFSHFPNTPHGERFSEEVTRSVAEALFSEHSAIARFKAPMEAGAPRDMLSQLEGDPLFEVFADNWSALRLLTAGDVDLWLRSRYPAHRRSLPGRIAAALGRAGRQSFRLRIHLARRDELEDPRPFSTAESVGEILLHELLRTRAVESFPQ